MAVRCPWELEGSALGRGRRGSPALGASFLLGIGLLPCLVLPRPYP